MQFSVFDLKFKEMELESEDDTGNPICEIVPLEFDIDNLAQLLEDDVLFAWLYFNLNAGEDDELPVIGPGRELVFAIGDHEFIVHMGPDGHVYIDNLDELDLLDYEDYLTLSLYQNGDDANVLWEYAISGLKVTSSSNEGSRQNRSFLIKDNESAITVELLADPSVIETLVWEVEALQGNMRTDDLLVESDGGSGDGNKPYAYGKTKNWRIGKIAPTENAQSSGDGEGGYSTPWQSIEYSGDEAMVFSFKPNLYGEPGEPIEPHTPATYTSGPDVKYALNGTKMSDIWRHNPHVGYMVTAIVNGKRLNSAIIQMDQIDVLRQEFINHNASLSTDSTFTPIPIPDRNKFVHVDSLPPGEWGSASAEYPYAYDYVLNDGTLRMWNKIKEKYSEFRKKDFHGETIPNNALKASSAFRNPERNERVGGAKRSYHMLGRAIDITFEKPLAKPSNERLLLIGSLWECAEGGVAEEAEANQWFMEDGATILVDSDGDPPAVDDDYDGIEDHAESASHIHFEDEF